MRHILSILVENESGALSRVAGLFSARGYNIESLTVAPTEDATLSRMTIVTTGNTSLAQWRKGLFAFMYHHARPETASFRLPPNRVVELGRLIEM